ncbi:MAG: hypothetical protein FJ194_06080 [Gammaproteobacteria bacterium]|nr:hypothetical protein [Gammaproteobacteria bacterium]
MNTTLKTKRLALLGFTALFFIAGIGATRLTVSDDVSEAMLPTDPETIARYSDYLARFPNDQGALVVFEDLLCSDAGWDLIKKTEAAFAASPAINRTLSLPSMSTRYVIGSGDTVDLSRFRDTDFSSAKERCKAAAEYPPYRNVLVSPDGRAAALFLIAEPGQNATTFSDTLMSIYTPLAAEAVTAGGRMVITGEAIVSAELSRVVSRDSALVAAILVAMLVFVYVITRSFTSTLVALGLSIFVVAVAYGFMGWVGMPLTPATSLVIFLLVPLTGTFVIHAHGYVGRQAERKLIPDEAKSPCILAGLTTAIGFACTGLTPAPDVQSLAIMGVVGIFAATLGVFIFVFPVLHGAKDLRFVVQFTVPRWPLIHSAAGIGLMLFFLLGIVYGMSRLKVDYGPTDYLPMTNSYRADYEVAGQWFGRMNLPLMVEVESAEDPQTWTKLKPLIDTLYEKYPSGFQAVWFHDQLVQLNRAVSGNPQAGFPEDPDTLAQLFIWFDPEDLELYMDEDRTRILINFQIPYIGSAGYFEMKAVVDNYLQEHGIKGYYVGRVASFFETGHRIGGDNLKGLAIGAALIFILLLFLFRSWSYAIIGIIINAIPVLSGLALLGAAGVAIDMGSSLVAAMAFGIVLDDTTHLLVRLQQLQRSGYDPATAVLRTVRELIAPVMTTTLAVCFGFVVLFFAEMQPFHDFAMLMITTMFIALIADVVLLPALVRQFVSGRTSALLAKREWKD